MHIKVGNILVDKYGRKGKISAVFPDAVLAHPIEVEPYVQHGPIRIATFTVWDREGIGYIGRWFDSPRLVPDFKAIVERESSA